MPVSNVLQIAGMEQTLNARENSGKGQKSGDLGIFGPLCMAVTAIVHSCQDYANTQHTIREIALKSAHPGRD